MRDDCEPYVRYFEESVFSRMLKVISLFEKMEKDKVIENYVIGGATALSYYSSPTVTEDIDVFITLNSKSFLINLAPIYEYIKQNSKAVEKGEYLIIEGIPVQLIVPESGIHEEACKSPTIVNEHGFKIKLFPIEYLMAIMIHLNKPKYKYRLSVIEEDEYDYDKLNIILKRYNLLEKWRKIKNEF